MTDFAGDRQLISEMSYCDQGAPPETGRHLMREEAANKFRVIWRKEWQDFDIRFAAASDGRLTPGDFPGPDGFCLRHNGEALVSEALAGGVVGARATPRAVNDLMPVRQHNADGQHGWLRINHVDRRS